MKLAILSLAAVTLSACSTMPQTVKVNNVEIRKDPSHMTAKDYLIPALIIGGVIGVGYLATKKEKEPEFVPSARCGPPAFACQPYMGGP